MNITFVPLKGEPNTIVGTWELSHGNSRVNELRDVELTEDELAAVFEVHRTLVRLMQTDNELTTEEYVEKIQQRHKVEESHLYWCFDVIRIDGVFEKQVATIESFSAVKYDENGDPHQVLFGGRPKI